ncbi:MAG: T9SS type A sorting domain-containing protein, partial [Mucilaginibacter sp.]
AGTSGSVDVTAPTGTSSRTGFSFIPAATISAGGPTRFYSGGSVLLTANQGAGYSYQWQRDGVNISGATSGSYTATQSGSYTVNVTVNNISQTSAPTIVTAIFNLPVENFKLAITSASCKGSADGSVSISAAQTLNYIATITGNGTNANYSFRSSETIGNLAAGSYSVCISVTGQPDYKQCYTAVVTEPQDLSVYSTINEEGKTITLAMTGGNEYHIQLNSVNYSTKSSSITLPLTDGNNDLTVTTDKFCQGSRQKLINISGKITPYPVPFQNTLYLNLGNAIVQNVSIEIYDVSDGRKVFSRLFGDQSGVLNLDLTNLNNGVYVLHLTMGNSEKIFKIVKK